MKKAWKLEGGDTVDLISYTKDLLSKRPDITEISVGSDSQNKKYNTCYVVCVAFKYGNRGAHCIYYKENVKKIRNRFTRLWGECERSVEIATLLKLNNVSVDFVELDFNKKELTGSNPMVKSSRGFVMGMGFECKVKPDDGLSSCKYADWVCRT